MKKLPALVLGIALTAGAFGLGMRYQILKNKGVPAQVPVQTETSTQLAAKVLPDEGVTLPVSWNDLGNRLAETGVIDRDKFEQLYEGRGGLDEQSREMLKSKESGSITITPVNSGVVLNLLWGLGLGNKNAVLEQGPMMDKRYGGAGNFASTAGWTLARGEAMTHYSKHKFINLNPKQQETVERVAQGIYRPCCNNSTYFPDCNHGMAMLGLLELMAAADIPEDEMYKYALRVNSYWFPEAYLTIAKLIESRGIAWDQADPKAILGTDYSSASGYGKVMSQVAPEVYKGGGGCGV